MIQNNKLRIDFITYNPIILKFLVKFLEKELKTKNFTGPFFLPKKKKVFCVLRSPFVNKDSRDIFEIRTYSAFFIAKFNSLVNLLKFLKLMFKKFSFEFSNNVYIKIKKI